MEIDCDKIQIKMIAKKMIGLVFWMVVSIGTPALADTGTFYGNQSLNSLVNGDKMMVNLPGGVRVEIEDSWNNYVVTDHLVSDRVAFKASDNSSRHYEYTPYGERPGAEVMKVSHRYAGHLYDRLQAVYETPNRNYDPTVTRFLSVDEKRMDPSPYLYAGNNPIVYLDPTGNGETPFFIKSGVESRSPVGQLANKISRELNGGQPAKIFDATRIFNDSIKKDGEQINDHLERLVSTLKSNAHPKDPHFSNELYWFISDERSISTLSNFEDAMGAFKKWQPSLAKKIILFYLSTKKDAKYPAIISKKFEDIGWPFQTVHGLLRGRGFCHEYKFRGINYFNPSNLISVIRGGMSPRFHPYPPLTVKILSNPSQTPPLAGQSSSQILIPPKIPFNPDTPLSPSLQGYTLSNPSPTSLLASQSPDEILTPPDKPHELTTHPPNPLFTENDVIMIEALSKIVP